MGVVANVVVQPTGGLQDASGNPLSFAYSQWKDGVWSQLVQASSSLSVDEVLVTASGSNVEDAKTLAISVNHSLKAVVSSAGDGEVGVSQQVEVHVSGSDGEDVPRLPDDVVRMTAMLDGKVPEDGVVELVYLDGGAPFAFKFSVTCSVCGSVSLRAVDTRDDSVIGESEILFHYPATLENLVEALNERYAVLNGSPGYSQFTVEDSLRSLCSGARNKIGFFIDVDTLNEEGNYENINPDTVPVDVETNPDEWVRAAYDALCKATALSVSDVPGASTSCVARSRHLRESVEYTGVFEYEFDEDGKLVVKSAESEEECRDKCLALAVYGNGVVDSSLVLGEMNAGSWGYSTETLRPSFAVLNRNTSISGEWMLEYDSDALGGIGSSVVFYARRVSSSVYVGLGKFDINFKLPDLKDVTWEIGSVDHDGLSSTSSVLYLNVASTGIEWFPYETDKCYGFGLQNAGAICHYHFKHR